MIEIRIEGEPVDLAPTTSLVLERFNPLLDVEQIQGSRVYGFDLPETPANRRLLGYLNQPQVGYQNKRFRCEKYLNGDRIEDGYVKIHDTNANGFSLFFTQNLGEIFGDRQNIPLNQLGLSIDAIQPVAGANHLVDRYAWPTIENPNFYGNQVVQGFSGRMNDYDGTNFSSLARVPMPFLGWVLDQYGALTGWKFGGAFRQDADLARLLLYNLFSLDGQSNINSNNHLPALTMPQLLMDLRKLFNLYLEFDVRGRVCQLDFSETVLAGGDVVDWTDKANPAHTKTPETANRLELGYDLDSNDALLKPVPALLDLYTTPETVLNEGGTVVPVRSRLSTLLTNPATGLAMTQQTGISPNNKDSQQIGSPRLLFWNGLVGGKPTATNTQGNRALTWHGANNLRDVGYPRFEVFKGNTFSLNKLVYLTPTDLATFSFRRKVHIRGVNYVVGSIKCQLSQNQRTIPTEAMLYRA